MAGKSRVPVYYAVGNHDIGIGDTIVPAANKRFRDVYGKVNYELSLGNHTIVVLDTLSFGASDEISKEAREFVKGFENRTGKYKIPLHETPNLIVLIKVRFVLFFYVSDFR